MKEAYRPEESFRRVAITAGIAIWIGLILLAVGLVFSIGGSSSDGAAMTALDAGGFVQVAQASVTATDQSPAPTDTATATSTLPATPITPSSTPTTPPTATATATSTPIPTPTPQLPPPSRLVIPSIGVDTPVLAVGWHEEIIEGTNMVVWDVADFAAGWHKTSARPGEGGNIVITGHHNIKGEVFRDIVTLQPGAEVQVYASDVLHVYYVTDVMILPDKGMPLEVRRENARWIEPTEDERVTLVTCWPYNNNTHRVIVVAKPAS